MKYFTNLCRLPGGPKGQYKWPRLTEVMRYMGIKHREVANQAAEIFNCERPTAHDSRFDVMAVYMIYKKTFHRVEIEPTNQREAVAMLTATLNEVAAAKQAAERDHSKKPTQKPKKRRIGCLTILIIIWILSVIFLTE